MRGDHSTMAATLTDLSRHLPAAPTSPPSALALVPQDAFYRPGDPLTPGNSDNGMTDHGTNEHVRIEALVSQPSPGVACCSCSCHSPLGLKSPQWLGAAVGMLLLRCTAEGKDCQRCSNRQCKAITRNAVKAHYYFPRWMLGCMLSFSIGWKGTLQ